jgi:hypothetical protein
MQRACAAVTALLVGVVLVAGPAGSSPASAEGTKPASYHFLKAQVFTAPGLGEVAVGMPNERTVKVQHRTEGGAWSAPTVLFRKKGVTCGQIDGRASAGGVALMVECDTPYYADQAPVHSRAFVTQDLVTWTDKQLGGEAYQDPAISADGSNAAWLFGAHGEYELFTEGAGFATGHTSFDYDSGGETVVVDDAGTVTVMGPDGNGHGCELGVWDKPLVGPETHYVIPGVNPGCTEGGVDNVDDRTVIGGVYNRAARFVVTREPGQRWVLTTRPPADAPSLVTYQGPRKQVIRNVFSDATGQPLVSLGGPDRHHVYAQAYDDATATWGPTTLVHSEAPGRCSVPGSYYDDPLPRMHLVRLRCTSGIALLTSPDSTTWTRTVLDHRPYAISTRGSLLAVPGRAATTVVSPSATVSLPVTAPGRCDFVYPIGPDSLLRLHGGAHARWPTKVQTSSAGGRWRTIQTVRMPATGACQKITGQHYDPPTQFFLRGDGHYPSVRVKRGGPGGWHVERFTF